MVAQGVAQHLKYLGETRLIMMGLQAFRGKRVLLLQGPLGPFFRRLARDLRVAGAEVVKIDFNGGDWLFSPSGSLRFSGDVGEWPGFLERTLDQCAIDAVLLFGDCRPLHRIALEVAGRRGTEIGVFEEGYLRPDYVTLERHGVNGHSQIPRDPEYYHGRGYDQVPYTRAVGNTFWFTACWALMYYITSTLLRPLFPRYEHHRPLTMREGWPWLRSVWRKQYFKYRERGIESELSTEYAGRFFLVALQVHNDAQIHVHSEYASVEAFIGTVIESFSLNAPHDTQLVIKHHPMDRGYHDYSAVIDLLMEKYGAQGRVRYIHDQHLPTLLEHARGVVLINSTVGLSALDHGTPLKVCGASLYDMPGLTYQGDLDSFWTEAQDHQPDRELHQRFRTFLIKRTQLNGNFYRRLNLPDSCAGLVWSRPSESTERVLGLPGCTFL